ncbi:MAG TPA: hypothetical protein DHW82_02255 [Spirochaetia bacterium]|nr:MAG: hypothetical protein A2Y41_03555 [Spirochaetes bacterium GWB1_36_13]HCL55816.1 hypothetical protein [Spirochaetia bacterium]
MFYLFPLIQSLLLFLIYITIWRIPLDFLKYNKLIRSLIGIFFVLSMGCWFFYFQPKFLIKSYSLLGSETLMIIPRTDIWFLILTGLFYGLFCMIPIGRWVEIGMIRPKKNKRKQKGLIVFAFLFVFLPHYFSLSAFTAVSEEKVFYSPWVLPFIYEVQFDEIEALVIDSQYRSSGKRASYQEFQAYILLKNQEKIMIFTLEDPDRKMGELLGKAAIILKKHGIQIENKAYSSDAWKEIFEETLNTGD